MSFQKPIQHNIFINAPVALVWNALTDPKLMKLWLWENEVQVISDWKPDSSMLFKGTFHEVAYTDKGNILKIEKEKQFSYNYWSHLSQLPDTSENYQVIEFILDGKGSQTELGLTCTNLINDAIYGHWNFYWKITLEILKSVIEKANSPGN